MNQDAIEIQQADLTAPPMIYITLETGTVRITVYPNRLEIMANDSIGGYPSLLAHTSSNVFNLFVGGTVTTDTDLIR